MVSALRVFHVSDDTGAAALLSFFPKADYLLIDRGYDAELATYALKIKA